MNILPAKLFRTLFHVGTLIAALGSVVISTSYAEIQGTEPQVILEEVEINIVEGGQVKERRFSGPRQEAYKVLERLKKEILPPGRRAAMRPVKQPKLKFVNRKGKVTKEILLDSEVHDSSGSAIARPGVARIRSSTMRKAAVSKSGTHAVLIETRGEVEFRMEASEDDGYRGSTSHLTFFDASGNVVWQKNLPETRIAGICKVSSDGGRVFCLESWTKFGGVRRDYTPPLIVRDRSSSEIFKFPESPEAGYHLWGGTSDLEISPNGRYAAIRASKDKKEIVLFIDVDKGSHWNLDMAAAPVDISDEGMARVVTMVGSKIESVDLRGKLR